MSDYPDTPITREEHYLAAGLDGGDLPDPITREDRYLYEIATKMQGGGGQTVNVQESKSVSITQNGPATVEPDSGYDAMAEVTVTANVPNTYTAGDEGKVVSSGALVAQTAHAAVTPTTSDQTVDTTTNNSTIVKGDANLVAGNIKSGVSIFLVTGSYSGAGSGPEALMAGTTSSTSNIVYRPSDIDALKANTYASASGLFAGLNWFHVNSFTSNPSLSPDAKAFAVLLGIVSTDLENMQFFYECYLCRLIAASSANTILSCFNSSVQRMTDIASLISTHLYTYTGESGDEDAECYNAAGLFLWMLVKYWYQGTEYADDDFDIWNYDHPSTTGNLMYSSIAAGLDSHIDFSMFMNFTRDAGFADAVDAVIGLLGIASVNYRRFITDGMMDNYGFTDFIQALLSA